MDIDEYEEFQIKALEILREWNQEELIEKFENAEEDDKNALAEQIVELDGDFPGGLSEYWERAKALLHNSKMGRNPFEGFVPSVPTGIKVEIGSKDFHEYETLGMTQMKSVWFVLVAGGLGERLGYPGIKVSLPITLIDKDMWYLRYYWDYIKAFEDRARKTLNEFEQMEDFYIPFCIMTSGDTNEKTISLLENNDYFGLRKDQVTIVKQEKVPALIDNDATFSLKEDRLEIETKPHGHGDVHTLLHQHNVIQNWSQMNKKWVVFFQDTNALVFRSIPSALGISTERDFDVNSIWVPRKPGDAVGGMATLTNVDAKQKITINIEYNQLEPLLINTWNSNGDIPDEDGYSHFPGNINVLIFKVSTYLDTLDRTGGLIPEFVNPKYKDELKEVFKSATRLECMMQDFPKLLDKDSKVGFSWYDRWFCFSAVKNNVVDAALKYSKGIAPECAASGEFDFFDTNARILKMAGASIEPSTNDDTKDFHGIKIRDGAKIVLHPSFGVTLSEIQNKFSGYCKISRQSVLVLAGEDTTINDFDLDGTVVLNPSFEGWLEGDHKDEKYVKYVHLSPEEAEMEGQSDKVK